MATAAQQTKPSTLVAQRRRNLVILRAGNDSLHEKWNDGTERNWDLVLSCYGDAVPDSYAEYKVLESGPKWTPLHSFIIQNFDLVMRYDYVCLADDDIMAPFSTWNNNFDTCRDYGLLLAQPALTEDSYLSHHITLQHKQFLLRYTNFVELMCPIFSREALKVCLSTMAQNSRYGWGQDFVWPKLLGSPRSRIAIIDGFPVVHTRPVGHNTDRDNAEAKMAEMMIQFGMTEPPAIRVHGAIFPEV